MSWQVRLGNLDDEIEKFIDDNPSYPVKNKKSFVKYAVRQEMKRWVQKEKDIEEVEKEIDKIIKDKLD